MIRLQLKCVHGDYFDAWFADHAAFAAQAAKRQIGCPHCGETEVMEAPPLKPGVYADIDEDLARQMACDTRRMLEGWIGQGGPGEALANDPAKTRAAQPAPAPAARPSVRPSRHVAYDC